MQVATEEGVSAIEKWKREATFYEQELARRNQIWEEREQALVNEVDMRDAELNALEHRVRKAALDVEASESARSEAVAKAQQLASRAEELEQSLAEALWNSEFPEAPTRASASSNETEKLRNRAQRAEEHVVRLGGMLADVCRQESQLVALLTSARGQLRQLGCTDEPPMELPRKQVRIVDALGGSLKASQPQKQPLATNNTGVSDDSNRVAVQQRDLNMQAKQQDRSRLMARDYLLHASKEAALLENEIQKLKGDPQQRGIRVNAKACARSTGM